LLWERFCSNLICNIHSRPKAEEAEKTMELKQELEAPVKEELPKTSV